MKLSQLATLIFHANVVFPLPFLATLATLIEAGSFIGKTRCRKCRLCIFLTYITVFCALCIKRNRTFDSPSYYTKKVKRHWIDFSEGPTYT